MQNMAERAVSSSLVPGDSHGRKPFLQLKARLHASADPHPCWDVPSIENVVLLAVFGQRPLVIMGGW